jgi:hypothetical protein
MEKGGGAQRNAQQQQIPSIKTKMNALQCLPATGATAAALLLTVDVVRCQQKWWILALLERSGVHTKQISE